MNFIEYRMSNVQTFLLIYGEHENKKSYYTNGIHICNIPFQLFQRIELQKITLHGHRKFTYNLFPALVKFQKKYRKWHRWINNPQTILARELTGRLTGP